MGSGGAGIPLRELGLVFLVACTVTYLCTGIIRSIMVRSGRIAAIRDRDVHTQPKPRLGGAAMFTGFLAAVFIAQQLPALTRGFKPITPEMGAVVMAGFVIVIVGIIDDIFEIDAITKLIGQILGAMVMSLMGLSWTLLYLPFGDGTTVVIDQFQSTVVTALFTVTLINAINFVDGLDGLAAGLGMISGCAILVFALTILHDQGGTVSAYPPAIIAAALVGICLGFLPHNFEPSRIFMGDSGSMDMVALISPFIVVVAAVFVPLLDLVMAVVRRVSKGRSPFSADKMHLHHRLLGLGHSHRSVVLLLYMWVSVVAFGAVAFSAIPAPYALAGILISLAMALVYTFSPVFRSARTGEGNTAAPEGRRQASLRTATDAR